MTIILRVPPCAVCGAVGIQVDFIPADPGHWQAVCAKHTASNR